MIVRPLSVFLSRAQCLSRRRPRLAWSGPNGTPDIVRFRRLLAERILTQFQGVPQAELDYIMDRLDADETELSRRHLAAAS